MIHIILETPPLDWILNISLHQHQRVHHHVSLPGTVSLRYLRERGHEHRPSSGIMTQRDPSFPVQTVHLPQLGGTVGVG